MIFGFALLTIIHTCNASGSDDMANIMMTLQKDNPEEYSAVMKKFISFAKNEELEEMLKITSDVTKSKFGTENLTNLYKQDTIPVLKLCNSISEGGDVIHVNEKQSPTGPGWVFRKTCYYGDDKSIMLQFVVLKENGRIALTSFGLAN